MESRLVPVDLLFVPSEGVAADAPGMTLLPLVAYGPMIPKWRARIQRLRCLLSATRPVVSQLSRDRLILESGVEQACLAKALDRRWMRVDMPNEVCKQWDSRSISRLQAVVKATGRKLFYNPVLHASYRRARVCRPDSIRLDRIRRLLGDCGEGLRGLDIGCNMGYMSHMFQRQGFRMAGVDFDENHLKVARALDETYSLDVEFFNCRFQEMEAADGYDVVIMLTVFYHTLKRSESEAAEMISKLDALGLQALFWESGDQPRQEIEFVRNNSGLTEYLSLGATYGTSLRRELGVFLRPSTGLGERFLKQYEARLASEFDSSRQSGNSFKRK